MSQGRQKTTGAAATAIPRSHLVDDEERSWRTPGLSTTTTLLKLIRNERESGTPKAEGVPGENTTQVERAVSVHSYGTKKTMVGKRRKER